MKKMIFTLVALACVTSSYARIITLNKSARVYRQDSRGDLMEVVTFKSGTSLEISDRAMQLRGLGLAHKVREVLNYDSFRSNHRYNTAIDIKRSRGYVDYFIGASSVGRVRNEVPTRPRVTRTYDYGYEYEVCYKRPSTYVREVVDKEKDKKGRRNRIIGGGLAIGGQIFGELTGNRRAGDAISAAGAGILIVGMFQVASASDVFIYDNGVDCRSYYTVDSYEHEFYRVERGRQVRCVTNRYYTTRWNGTSEYFETTCYGSRRSSYVSFDRSSRYWR